MIDSTIEPRTRRRMTAVNRAARTLEHVLAELDDVERRTLQEQERAATDAGGLADRVLANLPTWDDAEEFLRDYEERHFGPLRGIKCRPKQAPAAKPPGTDEGADLPLRPLRIP